MVPVPHDLRVAVVLQHGANYREVARALDMGHSTAQALIDPYGRVARKVLERVQARMADATA
jgi:transposase